MAWSEERDYGHDVVIILKNYFDMLKHNFWPYVPETRDLYESKPRITHVFFLGGHTS